MDRDGEEIYYKKEEDEENVNFFKRAKKDIRKMEKSRTINIINNLFKKKIIRLIIKFIYEKLINL